MFLFWIFQTGEPLHIDGNDARPMRAMNLSNALVEAGHRVVLWSSAFYHQEKRQRSTVAQRIKVSDRLEIQLVPSMGYKRHVGVDRIIDHAQLALCLKKLLDHTKLLPDAAFIGYPPIETAAVLARWLAKRGVPSLLDVKDQWPSFFLNGLPNLIKPLGFMILLPYFYLARRAMRDASGISSMAEGFLNWALRFAQRDLTDNDGVFPLTAPTGQVSIFQLEEARRWWDSIGLPDNGRPRFCFVGSHSPAFDFSPVKEAAEHALKEQLPWEFVLCGDGGASTELQAIMAGLPNVYFPGWVDRPKIEALAERCQAALSPYLNIENFTMNLPNKIIDSLSLGLPILSPLHGEVAKMISENGVGMRYGANTNKTLYECIFALTQDSTSQKEMSRKARALYAERFSFDMVYGGLVNHLEKLVGIRRGHDCPKDPVQDNKKKGSYRGRRED